jgi:hypothetical protein
MNRSNHRRIGSEKSAKRLLWRMLRDERAVAMIEFAMVFPIFILLLFGGIEITRAMLIHLRVERASFVIADVVTQMTPATNPFVPGQLNEAQMDGNIFPHFKRVMGLNTLGNNANQAIIITSIFKDPVNGAVIKWQRASAVDTLAGCDTQPTPNCVRSIVNDLAPGDITGAVVNTPANFLAMSAADRAFITSMPDGSNIIVTEVFFKYRPILRSLLQGVGAAGGTGIMGFRFFLQDRIYIKRSYLAPRAGNNLYLPPTFPAP